MRSNVPGCASKRNRSSVTSRHGTKMMSAIVRGSRRSCLRTRTAVARVTRGLTRPPRRVAGTLRRDPAYSSLAQARPGVPLARISPLAHEQQRVAAVRLVHHVARDEQRRTALGELGGTSSQRSRRRTGSCPTVGSSSTSSSGRPSSAAASEARARWPPESFSTRGPRRPRDRRSRAARRRGRAERRARARSSGGSRARQVGVDGRRLRDVCRRGGAAARSGGLAEHLTLPPATLCTPTIARISVDLPLPLGRAGPSRILRRRPRQSGSTTLPPRTTRRSRSLDRRHRLRLRCGHGDLPSSAGAPSRRGVARSARLDAVRDRVHRIRARRMDDAAEGVRSRVPGRRLRAMPALGGGHALLSG